MSALYAEAIARADRRQAEEAEAIDGYIEWAAFQALDDLFERYGTTDATTKINDYLLRRRMARIVRTK